MIGNFLGYFEKHHSCVKTALATFWATFGKSDASIVQAWLIVYSVTLALHRLIDCV